MKKFTALLCALLMVAACFPLGAFAAEGKGMIIEETAKYKIAKSFEAAPQTFEAWVCVPVGAGRAGVVVGNYAGSAACVNFEITTNGKPRLYVVEYSTGEKVVHDVTFNADVRTGEPIHVAIVNDEQGGNVYCYIDGELKDTKQKTVKISLDECSVSHMFAGDRRGGNSQYFKGTIGELALYSGVRTAEQIKADMNSVDTSDSTLIAYYDTFGEVGTVIPDISGNGYDVTCVKKWIESKEEVSDYAYSLCIVGDTQVVTERSPENLAEIYDWIVENRDAKKIKFVFGMGDITNNNTAEEWETAKAQISKLDGVVPYSLVRGNHDGTTNYNRYVATPEYMGTIGGVFENGKVDNAWKTFSVGDTDFLVLMLDYGASDAVLNWASGIIEAHPDHKVIITTHCYLYRDGTTLDAGDVCPPNASGANDGVRNNGDQMWDKLVSKHGNIVFVLSGHDPCDDVVATQTIGVNGNTVTQMLIDPQNVDSAEGATGMIAMLYVSKDGKSVTVENYSTVRDMYYMTTSQFTLEIPDGLGVSAEEPADTELADTEPAQPDESDAPETAGKSDDVTVIGGADGPTAVLVTGKSFPIAAVIALASLAIGFAVGFIVGKKIKK